MTELNIKKEIGRRIAEARKAKGFTLKELGELAGGLKQTRITNWEQGSRTPGPEEIKQLAMALDVSAAFLMGLTNEVQVKKSENVDHVVPLLNHRQVAFMQPLEKEQSSELVFVSISAALLPELSNKAFALKMFDESMNPEIRLHDVLIIDPDIKPRPGDFVVVLLDGEHEVIVRKYKQLSASKHLLEYELVALNGDWANIKIESSKRKAQILGCVVNLNRGLRDKF